ncbi:MAG: fibronectin type III domain-containing protein, partial [Bacteroidota bacterium]
MYRLIILWTVLFSLSPLLAQDVPQGTEELYVEGLPPVDSLVADSLDELPHLQLLTRYGEGGVRLRWAPNSPAAWLLGNHYGYRLERMDLSDPDIGNAGLEIIADNIRPLDLAGWKRMDAANQDNDYHLVAAEILHGGLLEELAAAGPNVVAAQKFFEYYSLALLAADLSWPAAEGLALGYHDRTAVPGKEYLYKISLREQSPDFPVREGAQVATTEKAQSIPPPYVERVEEKEFHVTLLLRRDQHERHFTAFNVERSADGGNSWQRLNEQPWLHAESEGLGTEFIIFTDSLASNYRSYQYRFQGITPFGSQSPFSEPVTGMGRDKTPPKPAQNLRTTTSPGPTIELTWEYPDAEAGDLAGFLVGRNDASLGTFQPLTETPLPPTTRSFIDPNPDPQAVNYYMVAAVDTAGNGAPSLVTHSVIIDSIPPAAPTGLSGVIDSNGIVDLSWERGPETDILGYQVYFAHADYHVFVQLTGRPQQTLIYQDTITIRSLK